MKIVLRFLGIFSLVLVILVVLALAFPGDAPPAGPELCGQARQVRAATNSDLSDERLREMFCDEEQAREMIEMFERKQYGD